MLFDAYLPTTILVGLNNGTSEEVDVTWNTNTYDNSMYGVEQTIYGTLNHFNYISNPNAYTASVVVVVEPPVIVSVETLAELQVEYNTLLEDVLSMLPTEVEVTLNGGEKRMLAVAWSEPEGGYDPTAIVTQQVFYGEIIRTAGITNSSSLYASIALQVSRQKTVAIKSIETQLLIVLNSTPWNDLILPQKATAHLENEDIEELNVNWDSTGYSMTAGTYTVYGYIDEELYPHLTNEKQLKAELMITVIQQSDVMGSPWSIGSPTIGSVKAYLCDDPDNSGKYVLYVLGEGATKDRVTSWNSYRNSITKVIVGDGVTELGRELFANLTNLNKIVLPDTLTTIGRQAFFSSGMSEVTIPASVTYIGTGAFGYCLSLESITFLHDTDSELIMYSSGSDGAFSMWGESAKPTKVFTINEYILNEYDWEADNRPMYVYAESITLDSTEITMTTGDVVYCNATVLPADKGGRITWTSSDSSIATVTPTGGAASGYPKGKITAVSSGTCTITATIDGVSVSCEVTVVREVIITPPSGVVYGPWDIGALGSTVKAYLCDDPENSGKYVLCVLGEGATKDRVTSWNSYRNSITKVEVGDGVTELGRELFANLTNLNKIVLPDTLTTIGRQAFFSSGMTEVTIPASVTHIDVAAFANCWNLETIEFKHEADAVIYMPSAGSNGAFYMWDYPAKPTKVFTINEYILNEYDWEADNRPMYVYAESITLDGTEITMATGDVVYCNATVLPADKGGRITWTSSDSSIATVTPTGGAASGYPRGKITAVSSGTCTITATIDGVSVSCAVTVAP